MADFLQIIYEIEVWANYTPITGGPTLYSDLLLEYRLGTTFSDNDTRFKWIQPTTGPPPAPTTGPDNYITAGEVPNEFIGAASGAHPGFTPTAAPTAGVGEWLFNYGEIYFRIWVVDRYMNPQNPERYVDMPFIIWNAYTISNTLLNITGSGQTGLTLDLTPPSEFYPVEERTVNLQITDTAPNSIYAVFYFNFDSGVGELIFETIVLSWLKHIPEIPVQEIWEFLTDIHIAHEGDEQRIQVRGQPRIHIDEGWLLEDGDRRAEEYQRIYNKSRSSLVLPFYQYSTRVTQDSSPPSDRVYFDPDQTDMRAGELMVVFRPSTEESYLLGIDTMETDGVTLDGTLTIDIYAGDLVAPAHEVRLDDGSGLGMRQLHGTMSLRGIVESVRPTFDRPESTVVIPTFDGLKVMEKCPLTRSDVDESFSNDPTIIDSQTGIHDQKIGWDHAFITGGRQFRIPRKTNPEEMDYWRDFLTEVGGMRVPWLLPTRREDLYLETIPTPSSIQIEIQGSHYPQSYYPHDTYKRLRLVNPDGDIIYRKVTTAEVVPGGTSLLTLDTALPSGVEWGSGFEIGYLNKVRFASDQFRLTHHALWTLLDTAVRTTDS